MSYEKQIFSKGQVLTADALNKMSEGIASQCSIIDVDKLPTSGWSGTTVPSDGVTVVKNLYFNTNLSIEETIAEMEKIDNWILADGENYILFSSDTISLMFLRYEGFYAISTLDSDILFASDGSVVDEEWNGWNPNKTYPLEINSVSDSELSGISVGKENDKITALFSTTPFTYSDEKPNENAIYRLKEAKNPHLEGTLLVSNPETTVNKVLFNDSLSNETMNEILSSLTYTNFNGLNVNVLFTNSTATKVIFAYNWAVGKYGLYYSTNIASGKADVVFYDDGRGWVTNEIEINDVGVSNLYGLPIGANNDALQQVLSMNDNFTEVAASYKYTYWAYKNKWTQLIDGDNFPDYTTIIRTTCSTFTNGLFDDITLTEEQFYTAKNAKDCLLIVTVGNLIPFYFRKTIGYYTGGDVAYDVVCFVGNRMSISSDETYIYTAPTPVMLTFTNKKLTANIEKLDLFRSFQYTSYGGLYIETGEGSASVEFDKTPTESSTSIVSSGGVFNALQEKQNKITVTKNADGTVDITIPTEEKTWNLKLSNVEVIE